MGIETVLLGPTLSKVPTLSEVSNTPLSLKSIQIATPWLPLPE